VAAVAAAAAAVAAAAAAAAAAARSALAARPDQDPHTAASDVTACEKSIGVRLPLDLSGGWKPEAGCTLECELPLCRLGNGARTIRRRSIGQRRGRIESLEMITLTMPSTMVERCAHGEMLTAWHARAEREAMRGRLDPCRHISRELKKTGRGPIARGRRGEQGARRAWSAVQWPLAGAGDGGAQPAPCVEHYFATETRVLGAW
jgi:hypothetical protein